MKSNIAILYLLSILACNNKTDKSNNSKSTVEKNIIKVEQFGDSMKIETEKRGDTIIRNFIDLKKGKDDNFDDSYTATSIEKNLIVDIDTSIKTKHFIEISGFRIYFEKNLRTICNEKINTLKKDSKNQEAISKYTSIRENFADNHLCIGGCFIDLLASIRFNIIHLKSGKRGKLVFIENYATSFSGGKNVYVVTETNDTLDFIHINEYMH